METRKGPRPADHKIDRCPRCGAWRYARVCTGACPVLQSVKK